VDVIIHSGREHYLLECKWEKGSIGAGTIRESIGKLSNRVGVRGAVVSMSGFSKPAGRRAADHLGTPEILLSGRNDVESLIHGQVDLDDLLDEEYEALITKREIVYA
jgi:hypothetical protein